MSECKFRKHTAPATTPCTLHLAPCTRHTGTVHPCMRAPVHPSIFRFFKFRNQSISGFLTLNRWAIALCILHLAPCTCPLPPAPCTLHLEPCHLAPCTRASAHPCTRAPFNISFFFSTSINFHLPYTPSLRNRILHLHHGTLHPCMRAPVHPSILRFASFRNQSI